MTADEYRANNPDFCYHDNIIEECLVRAEYIVGAIIQGEQVEQPRKDRAVALQTCYLLRYYGEAADECEEISMAALSALMRGSGMGVNHGRV